jgi:hypothetical protein
MALYYLKKIEEYKCNNYSVYLFIILDAAISPELISKNDSSIIKLLKIFKYMYISCALFVQIVYDSMIELKRLIGDIVLH